MPSDEASTAAIAAQLVASGLLSSTRGIPSTLPPAVVSLLTTLASHRSDALARAEAAAASARSTTYELERQSAQLEMERTNAAKAAREVLRVTSTLRGTTKELETERASLRAVRDELAKSRAALLVVRQQAMVRQLTDSCGRLRYVTWRRCAAPSTKRPADALHSSTPVAATPSATR